MPYFLMTVLVIFSSFGFTFSIVFCNKTSTRRKLSWEQANIRMLSMIPSRINTVMISILLCLNIVIFLVFWKDISTRFGAINSIERLGYYINQFRVGTSYGGEAGLSFITNQLLKVSRSITLCSTFLLIVQLASKEKNIKTVLLVLNIIPYVIESLLKGQRFFLIELIIFIFIIVCEMIFSQFQGHKNKANHKIIFFALVLLCVSCYVFSQSRIVVGRGGTSTIIEYIGSYFGSPMICLDEILKTRWNPNFTGVNTFSWINSLLNDFGLGGAPVAPFIYIGGKVVGNVHTCLFTYIQDFGYLSIPLLGFLVAFLMYLFYAKKPKELRLLNFPLFIYASMAYSIFMMGYHDFFCANILGLDFVLNMVICYVIFWFVLKCRIVINNRKG